MAEKNSINEPRKGKKTSGSLVNIVLILIVFVIGGFLVYSELQRRNVESHLKTTQEELEKAKQFTQDNVKAVAEATLAKVRLLIDVPSDPVPTVQVIADVEALRKTNDFFNKAENGDNIVITQNRAILYSPTKNIIIDVVPVVAASPSPSVSPVESKSSTDNTTN